MLELLDVGDDKIITYRLIVKRVGGKNYKQWQGFLKQAEYDILHFFRLIPLFSIIWLFTMSCSGNEGENMGNSISRGIEFLGRSDCQHSPAMEKNLVSALEARGIDKKYKYIDLASLPVKDYRRGYGTPTVLINGDDLFGMPKPMPIASAPT